MKNWNVSLTAGERSLAGTKVQRTIFKRDILSPLLFVTGMMPLNHIQRKCTAGYKLKYFTGKDQSPNVHGRHQIVFKK